MIWKGVQADRKMEPEVMRLDSLELGLCSIEYYWGTLLLLLLLSHFSRV